MLCRHSGSPSVASTLRSASIVLVIITADFMRSTDCLDDLRQACDEMQRQRQQDEQGHRTATTGLTLVPLFYRWPAPAAESSAISVSIIGGNYAAASKADRAQWLDDLVLLGEQPGIKQSSVAGCERMSARAAAAATHTLHVTMPPSVLRSDAGFASRRGDGALVNAVAAHLLRTMPPSPDPLISVAERVQHLQATMAAQDAGVVGLHGPAAIGKTAVAHAFFAEQARVATDFQRRIWLHVGKDAQHGVLQDR